MAATPAEPGQTPAEIVPERSELLTGIGVPRGRFRFQWQNDSWLTESDRFYTNGIGLGWTLEDGTLSQGLENLLHWLPFTPEDRSGTATELFVRQDMFTPEDFTNPALVLDDRPYAGWLHLDIEHQVLTLRRDRRDDRLDTWELQLGIVGPSALAEQAQREVHELVSAPEPRGWDNQLEDEPGIVLGYHRQFRAYYDPHALGPIEADFIGRYGARVGNVETSARIGGVLRAGFGLPRHFGTAMRGDAPGVRYRHRIYAAAGVSGKVVLRNIFLDGNTFSSSHSVDRNPLVAQFHVGLHWEPCSRARVSIAEFFSTAEFDSPSQEGDLGHFTSVQLELFF